jgi:hypothetical protein
VELQALFQIQHPQHFCSAGDTAYPNPTINGSIDPDREHGIQGFIANTTFPTAFSDIGDTPRTYHFPHPPLMQETLFYDTTVDGRCRNRACISH